MIEYVPAADPEFTAHEDSRGTIYHQRGEYVLNSEEAVLLPVNRSYRPLEPGSTLTKNRLTAYQRDRLIHDTIPEPADLIGKERLVQILGKSLLFLEINNANELVNSYSSKAEHNNQASDESKRILEIIANGLDKRGVQIELGVHGSHAVGLNGVDSDLDLIAWSNRDAREDSIDAINDTLCSSGYTDANTTRKFDEYAMRIANLTGLPLVAGAYLAKQRHRWMGPNGVSTSLQCLHADYDHETVQDFLNEVLSGAHENTGVVEDIPVEIIGQSEPFNYPRLWTVSTNHKQSRLISFNMVHQSMGSDGRNANNSDGQYLLKASHLTLENGGDIYLMEDSSHYLLPAEVL
jgi:hypothetical protein